MSITDNSFFHQGGRTGVLLIHGLAGTPTEMRYVGKGLAQQGYTVYGMQLPGHCGTEADLLATGWRDWAAGVEAACDALRGRVDRVVAGGLSMGAILALHLAARRPEALAGLLVYSATMWHDGWSVPRTRVLLPLLPLVLRLPYGRRYRIHENFPYGIKDERLRQRVLANMLSGESGEAGLFSNPGPSVQELRKLAQTVKRELSSITTPTLVVHARHDDVASIRNARYIERRLAGPVRTVLLDDCYHMITVDQQRADVVRHSLDFLSPLDGRTDAARPVTPAARAAGAVLGGGN